jgi:hypothetical protein
MPSRIGHDPEVLLQLAVGQDHTDGDNPAHSLVQVGDSDVQMLGCALSAVSSGVRGPGELHLALEIERWTVLFEWAISGDFLRAADRGSVWNKSERRWPM